MDKIFEGFFRVDSPYSRLTGGTGLGLPLSRKLVELHGGKLSVESPGLGKVPRSVHFTIVSGKRREMKRKALIVDDNRNNLELERDPYGVAGFEVFEAGNATSGIAIARRKNRIS